MAPVNRRHAERHRSHATATGVATSDPDSAYVLAYDAARMACTALLAQQGLRPTALTESEEIISAAESLLPHLALF